jgi:hypothetical protein
MRDTQKKMLEWIETIVTAYNDTGAALELLVNYSRENCGRIYVQLTDSFENVIECSFVFQSRYAVFDFGRGEMQVDYDRPETVMRVLDCFRSGVAAYRRECSKRPALVRT